MISKQFSGNYYETSDLDEINKYEFDSKQIPFVKISTFKGKDLENIQYEQLLDYAKPFDNPENAFRIITGDFVTTSDGTGIVHTAPTFGADDAFVAKNAKPPIPPMLVKDEYGDFSAIYGTLLTSFISLLITIPLGVGTAIFITEAVSYTHLTLPTKA